MGELFSNRILDILSQQVEVYKTMVDNDPTTWGARHFKVGLLDQNAGWIDRTGKIWDVVELSDDHLAAILQWLERYWEPIIRDRWITWLSDRDRLPQMTEWAYKDSFKLTRLGVELLRIQKSRLELAEKKKHDQIERRVMAAFATTFNSLPVDRLTAHRFLNALNRQGYKIVEK